MHVNFRLNIDCIYRWEKASEGNISDRPVLYIWISLLVLMVIHVSFVSQLLKTKSGLYESLPSRQIIPPYTWEYISRNPQERSRTMRGRVWLTESGLYGQMLFCIWIASSVNKVCKDLTTDQVNQTFSFAVSGKSHPKVSAYLCRI